MKKRILALGLVLVLVSVLVMPGTVLGSTTVVVGSVTEGFTFTAPSTVLLGSMAPSTTPYKANSTDGRLDGNNPEGYTVTAIGDSSGYMVSASSDVLANRLEISYADTDYSPADTTKTFLVTSNITGADISLYVKQLVTYSDPVATGYAITITFTVIANT